MQTQQSRSQRDGPVLHALGLHIHKAHERGRTVMCWMRWRMHAGRRRSGRAWGSMKIGIHVAATESRPCAWRRVWRGCSSSANAVSWRCRLRWCACRCGSAMRHRTVAPRGQRLGGPTHRSSDPPHPGVAAEAARGVVPALQPGFGILAGWDGASHDASAKATPDRQHLRAVHGPS